jgi:hypothetical protein
LVGGDDSGCRRSSRDGSGCRIDHGTSVSGVKEADDAGEGEGETDRHASRRSIGPHYVTWSVTDRQ